MAKLLFIKPSEVTSNTILSGNIDVDKLVPCIDQAQITTIEPLLGTELYVKLVEDMTAYILNQNGDKLVLQDGSYLYTNGVGLTGLYDILFKDFVKPILKFQAVAEYIEIGNYFVDNAGIYKNAPDKKTIADKNEVIDLSSKYRHLAQAHVARFEKWILQNQLPEYKTHQDRVNAIQIKNNFGWHL